MRVRVRQVLALVAAALLVGLAGPSEPVRAQSSAQPTFRASTTLVEFTMVAEDHNGNPVTDLKPDEVALAKITGGRTVRNTNDLTAGMKVAASDPRGSYSVGFYVPQNPDNDWHAFTVRVSRPDVKVIHRQGYLGIPARQPVEWQDEDWRAAANNPLGSTAIRLDARCTLLTDLLNVIVQIPAEDLQFRRVNNVPVTEIEVALAEKTPQGLIGVRHESGESPIPEGLPAEARRVIGRTAHPRSLHRSLRHDRHDAFGSHSITSIPDPHFALGHGVGGITR